MVFEIFFNCVTVQPKNTVEEEQSNSLEMTGNESGCLAFRRRRATSTVLQLFSQTWLTMTFVLYLGHEKFLTSS